MGGITFKRFPAEGLPEPLMRHWIGLAASQEAFHNPFFSPHFARAASLASPGNCYVTVLFREDSPIGYFPFQFAEKAFGRAERIGRHLSDYNGLVCLEPVPGGDLTRMLAASGIHQYAFDHLHAFQAGLGLPGEYIREGCATELPLGFEPYWSELEKENPRIAKDTLRCEKKIAKEIAPLEFLFHSPDRADLDTLIEIKRAQYKSTGVADSLDAAWTRQCLANLQETQTPDFRGVLSKLTAGGRLISLHFGILANGVLHFWFPIYVPEFSKYSPGRLLFYHLLKHAGAEGIKSIDQGMGAQKYKTNFTNREYKLGVGTLRRNTPQCLVLRAQDYLQYRKNAKSAVVPEKEEAE